MLHRQWNLTEINHGLMIRKVTLEEQSDGDAEPNSTEKVEPHNIVSGNRISKYIEYTLKYRQSSRIAHSKYSPEHET